MCECTVKFLSYQINYITWNLILPFVIANKMLFLCTEPNECAHTTKHMHTHRVNESCKLFNIRVKLRCLIISKRCYNLRLGSVSVVNWFGFPLFSSFFRPSRKYKLWKCAAFSAEHFVLRYIWEYWLAFAVPVQAHRCIRCSFNFFHA